MAHDLHDTAITAGFVMEGMHDAGYDRAIHAWGRGAFELVDSVMAYVPVVLTLQEAVEAAMGDEVHYPGVFDYEVSCTLGDWLAQAVIKDGDLPEPASVIRFTAQLVTGFFTRGKDPSNAKAHAAIDAAAQALLDAATEE